MQNYLNSRSTVLIQRRFILLFFRFTCTKTFTILSITGHSVTLTTVTIFRIQLPYYIDVGIALEMMLNCTANMCTYSPKHHSSPNYLVKPARCILAKLQSLCTCVEAIKFRYKCGQANSFPCLYLSSTESTNP